MGRCVYGKDCDRCSLQCDLNCHSLKVGIQLDWPMEDPLPYVDGDSTTWELVISSLPTLVVAIIVTEFVMLLTLRRAVPGWRVSLRMCADQLCTGGPTVRDLTQALRLLVMTLRPWHKLRCKWRNKTQPGTTPAIIAKRNVVNHSNKWLPNFHEPMISVDQLEQELVNHPDKAFTDYLTSGCRNGFDACLNTLLCHIFVTISARNDPIKPRNLSMMS